jgi:hypothetical protein
MIIMEAPLVSVVKMESREKMEGRCSVCWRKMDQDGKEGTKIQQKEYRMHTCGSPYCNICSLGKKVKETYRLVKVLI